MASRAKLPWASLVASRIDAAAAEVSVRCAPATGVPWGSRTFPVMVDSSESAWMLREIAKRRQRIEDRMREGLRRGDDGSGVFLHSRIAGSLGSTIMKIITPGGMCVQRPGDY